ncbi:MAG TPA: hypothetical protein VN376_07370 [Longilinea sp.]|nr:hypothetical protein [Longilinea sp.]
MKRSWLVIPLLGIGLVATAVALWQPAYQSTRVYFPEEITLSNGQTIGLGTRWVDVRSPVQIPFGMNADLTVEAGDSASGTDAVTGYDVVLEARPDFIGCSVSPTGMLSEPFPSGGTVNLSWDLHPNQTGNQDGTLWLYVRIVGQQLDEEQAIFALPIVFNTWGIGDYEADWAWLAALAALLTAAQLSRVRKPKS